MAELVISNLVRSYGGIRAVDDVSLTVADGEFVTLLGPSGCGKSTTLFGISGLDAPTSGRISLGGVQMFGPGINVPPERRDIGLVFQSYALWPHMTVRDNLAFPLRLRRIPAAEQDRRIAEALTLVEMEPYAARFPFELSGGQQQRVALARALVYQPQLLLLDEPLSNLDAKLRERARVWLREIQQRLKITTIYVTHDQSEALAISDRIVVMQGGRVCQIGTPDEVYFQPRDRFVADFIGSSNFLPGEIAGFEAEKTLIRMAGGHMLSADGHVASLGAQVVVAVKPERVRIVPAPGANTLPVEMRSRAFMGSSYQYELRYGDAPVHAQTEQPVAVEGTAHLVVPSCEIRVFVQ